MERSKVLISEVVSVLVLMVGGLMLLSGIVSTDLTEALPNSFVQVVGVGLLLGGLVSLISVSLRKESVVATIIHSGGLFLQLWVTVASGLASFLILPGQSAVAVVVALLVLIVHGIRLHQLSLITRNVSLLSMVAPLQSVVDELDLKMSVLVKQTAAGIRYSPRVAMGSSSA